ncbi:hypothetical protein ACSVDA_10420 [Cytobacillus sp. Hm23]
MLKDVINNKNIITLAKVIKDSCFIGRINKKRQRNVIGIKETSNKTTPNNQNFNVRCVLPKNNIELQIVKVDIDNIAIVKNDKNNPIIIGSLLPVIKKNLFKNPCSLI